MKSKALEFINEHSYGNNRVIDTKDDALSQILNNLKTNSSKLQLLKASLVNFILTFYKYKTMR